MSSVPKKADKLNLSLFLKDPCAMSELSQVKAWHQTDIKPLNEPIMNQFTDGYMHH